MNPHEKAEMAEILDYLQEVACGLSELRWRQAHHSLDAARLYGFLANVRYALDEAVTTLNLIEASLTTPAA